VLSVQGYCPSLTGRRHGKGGAQPNYSQGFQSPVGEFYRTQETIAKCWVRSSVEMSVTTECIDDFGHLETKSFMIGLSGDDETTTLRELGKE